MRPPWPRALSLWRRPERRHLGHWCITSHMPIRGIFSRRTLRSICCHPWRNVYATGRRGIVYSARPLCGSSIGGWSASARWPLSFLFTTETQRHREKLADCLSLDWLLQTNGHPLISVSAYILTPEGSG